MIKALVQYQVWWPSTTKISQGFLLRVLLVRALLTALAICALDKAFYDAAASGEKGHSAAVHDTAWGLRQRLGLLGLLAPLLSHAVGVLWPFLHIAGYERHYQQYHKVTWATTLSGNLLNVLSRISSYQGCCQQNMLLHGVLFLAHQDDLQQHIQHSALMVATYSICHAAAQSTGPTRVHYSSVSPAGLAGQPVPAEAAQTSTALHSSSFTLPWIASGGYAVHVFLLLLLLHRLYQAVVGPREVKGSANVSKPASGAQNAQRRSNADSRAHISVHNQHQQQAIDNVQGPYVNAGPITATTAASAVAADKQPQGDTADQQQLPQQQLDMLPAAADAAAPELNRAYVVKLMLVKAAAALQIGLYSIHCSERALIGVNEPNIAAPLASPAVICCLVGLLCVAANAGQVLTAIFAARHYLHHNKLINSVCFYVSAASSFLLLWLESTLAGRQGCPLQHCFGAAAAAVHSQHVFRPYLMLACSLVANEDGFGAFAMHLSVVTVTWRYMHIMMASGNPASVAAAATTFKQHMLELPEYYLVGCILLLAYKWLCVGMFKQHGPVRIKPSARATQAVSKTAISLSTGRRSSSLDQKRTYRLSNNTSTGLGLVEEATGCCQTPAATEAGSTAKWSKQQQQQPGLARSQQASCAPAARLSQDAQLASTPGASCSSAVQKHQPAVSSVFAASAAAACTATESCQSEISADVAVERVKKAEQASSDTAREHTVDHDAISRGSRKEDSFIWQQSQQKQQMTPVVVTPTHTLPKWTKEGLARLKRSTFDIPAKEICEFKPGTSSEEAAAATAAATAAVYCMAQPADRGMLLRRTLSMVDITSIDGLASSLGSEDGSANPSHSNKRRSSACLSELSAMQQQQHNGLFNHQWIQSLSKSSWNAEQGVCLRNSGSGSLLQVNGLELPGSSGRSRRSSRSEAVQQQQQQQRDGHAGNMPTVGSFPLQPTSGFRRPSGGFILASQTLQQQQQEGSSTLPQTSGRRGARRASASDVHLLSPNTVCSEQLLLGPVRYKVRRASACELWSRQATQQRQAQLSASRLRRGSVNEMQMWRLQQQRQRCNPGYVTASSRRRSSASELFQQQQLQCLGSDGAGWFPEHSLLSGGRSRRGSMLVCTPATAPHSHTMLGNGVVVQAEGDSDICSGPAAEVGKDVTAHDVHEAIQFTPVWVDRGQLGSALPAPTEHQLLGQLLQRNQQYQQGQQQQQPHVHKEIQVDGTACIADIAVPPDQKQQQQQQSVSTIEQQTEVQQPMQLDRSAAASSCQDEHGVNGGGPPTSLRGSYQQFEADDDMYASGDTYASADSEPDDIQEMTLAEVYAAAAAAAGIVLPSSSCGEASAGCLEESSLQGVENTQQQQRRVRDVVVCLQRLPMEIMWTCQIVAKTSQGLLAAGRAGHGSYGLLLLSSAIAAAYCCGCLAHLYLLLCNPSLADSRRTVIWPVKLSIGTPLIKWALLASRSPNLGAVLQVLVGQAATWATLELPRSRIVPWVFYAVISFYCTHLWTCWTRSTAQQLALDAAYFLVCPILVFIICEGTDRLIKSAWAYARAAWKLVTEQGEGQRSCSWLWDTWLLNYQHRWTGVYAVADKAAAAVRSLTRRFNHISIVPLHGLWSVQHLCKWGMTVGHVLLAITLAGMLAAVPLYRQHSALLSSSTNESSRQCSCVSGAATASSSCCSRSNVLHGLVWFTSGAVGTKLGQNLLHYAESAANGQWQAVEEMLQRMDVPMSPAFQETLSGVLLVLMAILAITAAHALFIKSNYFSRPRQVWYESAKQAVLTIGERTLSLAVTRRTESLEGDPEIEALLDTLWDVVRPLVSGCSMVLTLLDESTSTSSTATQHIMLSSVTSDGSSDNSGSDSGSASTEESRFLPPVQLPLSALPSVQSACEGHRVLFTSKFHEQTENSTLNFSDWKDLAKTYGADCFLAVPLCFAQLDMGTLLLMSDRPAALDKHVKQLVIELGLVVAQTLYTLLCMQQMRAGDCIINDILPEKVAEHLRRRMMSTRAVGTVGCLNYGISAGNLFQPVQMRLGTAASLRSPTMHSSLQQQQQQHHVTQVLGGVDLEALDAKSSSWQQCEQQQKQRRKHAGQEPVLEASKQQQQQQLCAKTVQAVSESLDMSQLATAAQTDHKLTSSAADTVQSTPHEGTPAQDSKSQAPAAPLGDESLMDQVPPLPSSLQYSCADEWANSFDNSPFSPLSSAGFVARRVFARAMSSGAAGLPGVVAPNSIPSSLRLPATSSRRSFHCTRAEGQTAADRAGLGASGTAGVLHSSTPWSGATSGLSVSADGAVNEQMWVGSSRRSRRVSVDEIALAKATATAVVYKQWHPKVTVLFADIVGYTALSQEVEPEQVMLLLHQLFSRYDNLCRTHEVYKVETIGDCWMGATGLLADDPAHASRMVAFAKDILAAAASVNSPVGGSVIVRVGVHSGRVMSGIVGSIRARYCLFGDTVNTASRMESTGLPGCLQISEQTYMLLPSDVQAQFEPRDAVLVKGKGTMRTYVAQPPSVPLAGC